VRAVLDPNVLVSAVLSRSGAPAEIVSNWLGGEFELIVSPLLLDELERVLEYPKLRKQIAAESAAQYAHLFRERAVLASDPEAAVRRSPDPADDYLIALAEAERALLVSGDEHLLTLAEELPIFSPREFLATLESDALERP
jgi:hypothetical protein